MPFVKARVKPGVSSAASVLPGVASAGTGTRVGGDTSRVKGLGTGVSKLPAKSVPSAEKESPFGELGEAPARSPTPEKRKQGGEVGKPAAAWWKRPGVLAGAVGASLALVLMAVIIIKIKLEPSNGDTGKPMAAAGDTGKGKPPPEAAFVVLEVDQPGVEVLVDGQEITVNVRGDNKPVKIKVEPGQRNCASARTASRSSPRRSN